MNDDELIAQFKKCEKWKDAEQWDLLAMEYFRRGYVLNAGVCFQRADALRIEKNKALLVGVSAVDVAMAEKAEPTYANA